MGQLDASIVTVALPTLQKSFHASVGSVTWVGLSYLLVLVATVTAVGRFADMWGRKLLYVYGFVIFIVASALCGFAPDLAALCGFRALQALGAAMLQANSLAIICLVVPARSLGRAIGLQGAAQAIGLALGPSVGGLLAGGRRVAADLLRQRAAGRVRRGRRRWPWSPAARTSSKRRPSTSHGPRPLLPRRRRPAHRHLLRCHGGMELAAHRRSLPGGDGLHGVVRAPRAGGAAPHARHRPLSPPALLDRHRQRGRFLSGHVRRAAARPLLSHPWARIRDGPRRARAHGPARDVRRRRTPGREDGRSRRRPATRRERPRRSSPPGWSPSALLRPGTTAFLLLLGLVGAGLGLFTAPNNATIMGSVPAGQAGMASGVLNMSRGIGTALGLSLTGLLFSVSGGASGSPARADHAFTVTALVLAAIAAAAGAVAAAGPKGPLAQI